MKLTRKKLKRRFARYYRYIGISLIFLTAVLDHKTELFTDSKHIILDILAMLLVGLLLYSPARTLVGSLFGFVKKRRGKKRGELYFFSTSRSSASRWPLVQNIIATLALALIILWLSRWFSGFGRPEDGIGFRRFDTFLHAGLFMAFWAFLLGSRRLMLVLKFLDLTPARMVILLYGVTSITGTLLLILPFSLKEYASIKLIDAFFLSVSALTVTGLVPVNVGSTFSLFGQMVLLAMIQLGGLGIVIISFGLASIARNRLSLAQHLMAREQLDLQHMGSLNSFVQKAIAFTLIAELIGAVWIYFSLPADQTHRFFTAVFLSISGFCNAGFTTFQSNLDIPGFYSVKVAICVLIFFGALGFPIAFEFIEKLKKENRNRHFSSSLVLTTTISMALLLIGGLGIFIIESFSETSNVGAWESLGQSFFHSIGRTAGFNVSDISATSFGTQLLMMFLMVVGGAPLSVAGGIKTTTAGVIVVAAISLIRGHKWVQFRNSEISPLVLYKCVTIIVLYFTMLFLSIFLLVGLENQDPWVLTFEAVSALSTVGFSLGATAELGNFSKLLIIGLMLAGRLGLVTIVYIGIGRVTSQRYRLPHEHFYVG